MLDRDPRALAGAVLHPPRGQILSALSERSDVTVRQVAERLGLPARRVRHHLEAMVAANLVEVTSGGPGTGAGPRRYGTEPVTFEDWQGLTIEMRAAVVQDIVRLLVRDVSAAGEAGTFGTRTDDHAVRMYGEVDEVCLAELAAIHWRVYREMGEAIEAGKARVAAAGEPGIEIISALFFFEAPHWDEIASPRLPGRPPGSSPRVEGAGDGPLIVPAGSLDPEAIAAAQADPVRSRVLYALPERPGVSIREIGERVGGPPRRVRHQAEALLAAGLATVTAEELRPGVVERCFGTGSLLINETAPLDLETRAALARDVALLLLSDVAAASAAGTFGSQNDEFEVRFYGEVDEACLGALADLHRRVHPEIQPTIEAGRERVRASGGKGIELVSAFFFFFFFFFFFEAPVWHTPPPRARAAAFRAHAKARIANAPVPLAERPGHYMSAIEHSAG